MKKTYEKPALVSVGVLAKQIAMVESGDPPPPR